MRLRYLSAFGLALACVIGQPPAVFAQAQARTLPVFVDGQAQVVPGFADSTQWIRHDLWVETGFDTDGDGRRDRVHVAVTRQRQTETEELKVPVIYGSSPYFAGTASTNRQYLWDVRHEIGAGPPKRTNPPPIETRSPRPRISNSQSATWVPRGFAVVHSSSPGTGLWLRGPISVESGGPYRESDIGSSETQA